MAVGGCVTVFEDREAGAEYDGFAGLPTAEVQPASSVPQLRQHAVAATLRMRARRLT
jgi:hypothetical protein